MNEPAEKIALGAPSIKQNGSVEDVGVEGASMHAGPIENADNSGRMIQVESSRFAKSASSSSSSSKLDSGAYDSGGAVAVGKRPRRKTAAPVLPVPAPALEKEEAASTENAATALHSSNGGRKAKAIAINGVMDDESVAIAVAAAPGLENKTGQHSCFVNVVVQTLWSVSAFRDAFLAFEPHQEARIEDRSIFLAMKQVCSMLEDTASAATVDASHGKPQQATANALKEALFHLDSSFELGEMHDATEAHEALLEALHRALAPPPVVLQTHSAGVTGGVNSGDFVRIDKPPHGARPAAPGGGHGHVELGTTTLPAPSRIPSAESFVKDVFSMRMRMEYSRPSNPQDERSKPVTFDQWTQYVVASELRRQVREATGEAAGGAATPLMRVLRMATGIESSFVEGEGQLAPGRNKLHMLRTPRVFTLGLASDTAHASKSEIGESLQGIDERVRLRDVYEGTADTSCCRLVALTAFYEQHYVCFCFSHVAGQWIHYDDDTRRLVGKDFSSVKDKCIAGRLHPQLLFYEALE